jgi:flagellar biosynthetic protein FliR
MQSLNLEQLMAAAVFVGARVAGLMVFCPFLGSNVIPSRLKAILVLLITALLYPLRGPLQLDLSSWQWTGVVLGEVVIGLLLGLTANLLMEAVMLAGQVLGVQMGYSLASLFDPQTQADTPVLGELHRLAALFIFLQLDVHHWWLRALVRSFGYLPAGAALATPGAVSGLLHAAAGIFLAGVQIAAPGLMATLLVDVALGFLGKASPQLPVLFIGLAVKNIAGLLVLFAVIAYWPHSFSQRFADAIGAGERLLRLAH